MDKRKIFKIILIFISGIILGFLLSSLVRVQRPRNAGPSISNSGQTVLTNQILDQEKDTLPRAAGEACHEWDKNATYTGGDRVLYKGRIYKAKWWTLGEIPGKADVWEDTLETPYKPEAASSREAQAFDNSPQTSGQAAQTSPHASAQSSSDFKVVGYYPDWKSYQPEKLQMDILTHIVYAFAIPTSDGGLLPLEQPETAALLIEDAHKKQVKVLLAVGGWSHNGAELEPVFVNATSTSEKTRRFGDEILAMCQQYGFDGVDIDWEHPRTDGPSKDQYQELILYLADRLHDQGRLLTSAVISGVSADGNIYYDAAAHSDDVLSAVDWINVMAYDGGDGERHSSYEFAVNSASYWRSTRNVPAGKVVLGVPFYGRPSWASYEDILAADPEAWNRDHAMINGMEAFYNGVSTMEKKAAYARDNLGGIMIWELTQDTGDSSKSLLSAIGRGIR